eukprot:scaffold3841_cov412-Prasinococcus_capsulatus_cf.AAC.5
MAARFSYRRGQGDPAREARTTSARPVVQATGRSSPVINYTHCERLSMCLQWRASPCSGMRLPF